MLLQLNFSSQNWWSYPFNLLLRIAIAVINKGMDDFQDTTSSELFHLSTYISTYLSAPKLSNLFRAIIACIRDQIHKTILYPTSPPFYTSLHTVPFPISKFSLFITYYPTYTSLPNPIDPHPFCNTTIYCNLPFTTCLFLQYYFNTIISMFYILYSTYILYCADYF